MNINKPIFTGICTALVTPFDEDGNVDYKSFRKLIRFQIENGTDALLFLGTTGEAPTLSPGEKKEIVTFAIQTVSELTEGKSPVPLAIGIGGNNPAEIIKFGKWLSSLNNAQSSENLGNSETESYLKAPTPDTENKAESAISPKQTPNPSENPQNPDTEQEHPPGPISAVLLSSPYYNKASQAGLVTYFHTIANEIRLPVIAYNVPGRTGQNIKPETLAQICENPYIAGIKEASGNINQITETIRLCPNTPVYCGDDALAFPAYALGAAGTISVASNAIPAKVRQVYCLYRKNRTDKARELFFAQLPFYKAVFCEVNPIPIKYLLSYMGIIENQVRLPLTPLDEKWYTALCRSYHSAAST